MMMMMIYIVPRGGKRVISGPWNLQPKGSGSGGSERTTFDRTGAAGLLFILDSLISTIRTRIQFWNKYSDHIQHRQLDE